MPFDEKWDFVARKGRNCEPDEGQAGDRRDHVALHPAGRSVVSPVVGKRTSDATHGLAAGFRRRTGARIPWLLASDECPADAGAVRAAYGPVVQPPRTGRPGRPRKATLELPAGLTSAAAHKHRANGRAVRASTALCSAPGSACCWRWRRRRSAGR